MLIYATFMLISHGSLGARNLLGNINQRQKKKKKEINKKVSEETDNEKDLEFGNIFLKGKNKNLRMFTFKENSLIG